MTDLFEELGACGAGSKLVLMDACRNELKARSRSALKVSGGMVPSGVEVASPSFRQGEGT